MRKDFRLVHQVAFQSIEQWSQLRQPNIVAVHEAFTTRSFGDNCPSVTHISWPFLNHPPSTCCCLHLPPERSNAVRRSYQAPPADVRTWAIAGRPASRAGADALELYHPDCGRDEGCTRPGLGGAHD